MAQGWWSWLGRAGGGGWSGLFRFVGRLFRGTFIANLCARFCRAEPSANSLLLTGHRIAGNIKNNNITTVYIHIQVLLLLITLNYMVVLVTINVLNAPYKPTICVKCWDRPYQPYI